MLSTPDTRPAISDYAELKKRIVEAGLLKTSPFYSILMMAANTALVILGILLLVFLHAWWQQSLIALYLAFVFTQIGFMGHDAGHRQMFEKNWKNSLLGLIYGNLILGMSYGWWNDKHNAHHANPNVEDMDPDIETPIVAYSRDQALSKVGIARAIVSRQAYLFFPILGLLAFSMHISSVQFLFQKAVKRRNLEILFLVLHPLVVLLPLFLLLGWKSFILVFLIHHIFWGIYTGSVFAPNHKGMPVLSKNNTYDFLRKQVITARNVSPSRLVDYLYGSLNYQVDHHLFPSMSRANLPQAHRLITQFCQEKEIAFHEVGVTRSVVELLSYLHEVSRPLREPKIDSLAA